MAIGAFISAIASLASRAINQNESDRVRREQNLFNKYEAVRAREWSEQMDSSKYQRTVADMQSAGVNPALAMQGGVSTQAASNTAASAANVAPAQMDLSSVAQLAMQARQLDIQEKVADAQSRKLNADAKLSEIDSNYRDNYNKLLTDGMDKSNSLTEANIAAVRANIGKINEEVELLKKQAKTEEERALLTAAQTAVQNALKNKTSQEIRNMVALLPFQEALMAAQTDSAKAQAAAAFAEAAYKNGLIDSGYIDSMVRSANVSADEAEARKISIQIQNNLKTGNWFNTGSWSDKVGNSVLSGMTAFGHIISNFIPIKL